MQALQVFPLESLLRNDELEWKRERTRNCRAAMVERRVPTVGDGAAGRVAVYAGALICLHGIAAPVQVELESDRSRCGRKYATGKNPLVRRSWHGESTGRLSRAQGQAQSGAGGGIVNHHRPGSWSEARIVFARVRVAPEGLAACLDEVVQADLREAIAARRGTHAGVLERAAHCVVGV